MEPHRRACRQALGEAQARHSAVAAAPMASAAANTQAVATATAWQNFYKSQMAAQTRQMPTFVQTLVQAFLKHRLRARGV